MEFNLAEKLAIVKMVESVIMADGIVHDREINALGVLMKRLDFESNFLLKVRTIEMSQGIAILKDMIDDKKNALALILEEMAIADGHFHEKEMALILKTCQELGINAKKER